MLRLSVVAILLGGAAATGAALVWQDPLTIASGRGAKGPWRQNGSHYDHVTTARPPSPPAARIRVAQSHDGGASFAAPLLAGGQHGRADAPALAVDGKAVVNSSLLPGRHSRVWLMRLGIPVR